MADVISNLLDQILGKDTQKEKQHEVELGRLKKPVKGKQHKTNKPIKIYPCPPWQMDKTSIATADERLESLLFPPASSLRPQLYFSKPTLLFKMEMKIRVSLKHVNIVYKNTQYMYKMNE